MRRMQRTVRTVVMALPLTACAVPPSHPDNLIPLEGEVVNGPASANQLSILETPLDVAPPGLERTSELEAPYGVSASEIGEEKRGISLSFAVTRALSWHPSIDQAVGTLNQRTQEIDVARAGYFPSVNAGIGPSYDNQYKRVRQMANASVSQMVYDFGKTSYAVEGRVASESAGQAQVLMAVDAVIRDTAYAFVETQRYLALLDVAKTQVAGIESIAQLVRQRADIGASTRSDLVQADARVQGARSRVLEVTAQLNQWRAALANLMGTSEPASLERGVPAWLMRSCESTEPDWTKIPAAMRAEAEYEQAQADLDASSAEIYPTLALQASGARDLNPSVGQASASNFNAGLTLQGNLYNGGASVARREAASFALSAAQAARMNVRFQVKQALSVASSQTSTISMLLASLSARGGMTEETRDLYRRQYLDMGTRTLLDLLNAEQEMYQVQFDIANTTHDLRRLNVDCLFNSGMSRQGFSLNAMTVRGVPLVP